MRYWMGFIGIHVIEYSDQMSFHSAYLYDQKIGNLSHPLEVFCIKTEDDTGTLIDLTAVGRYLSIRSGKRR